eukprot:11518661-Alexandrium_andersonii.AAC.1
MSASLVGSEMCIRDSHSPSASRRTVRVLARPAKYMKAHTRRHVLRDAHTCLLYTSDAADDM